MDWVTKSWTWLIDFHFHCCGVEWWHCKHKQVETDSLLDEPTTREYASVSVFPVVPFWLSGISHLSVLLSGHSRFTNPNFCLHSSNVTKGWAEAKDFKNGSKEGSPGKPAVFCSPPLEKLERKKIIILFVPVSCAIMFPYFSMKITSGKYFSNEPLKGKVLHRIKGYLCILYKTTQYQSRACPGPQWQTSPHNSRMTLGKHCPKKRWSILSKRITPASSPSQLGLGQRLKSFPSSKTLWVSRRKIFFNVSPRNYFKTHAAGSTSTFSLYIWFQFR